jgi:pSer/pThr/pTyr-binding forkhead associated (FHA) protein
MASIIIATGEQKGDFYPLGHRTNVVGRDEALPIQILDEHVSRKHMRIRFDEESKRYSVIDMGSKNGVLINGAKIDKETVLTDGDYITIGDTTLMFTLKDFKDRESALSHYKKVGERSRPTQID